MHDPAEKSLAAGQRMLAPGDWAHIDYQGRVVLGMIDRLQADRCTFAYWDGDALRFGTAKPEQIGGLDLRLTAQFREAIALDPNYLAKFIAKWAGKDLSEPQSAVSPTHNAGPRWGQRRLFPE
jgi:hypothetical protein